MSTLSTTESRLLIAVNTAEFFLSHRRHLAEGAKTSGWNVWVLCPPSPAVTQIQQLGFSVVTVPLGRKSMNPLSEFKTLWDLYKAIQFVNPQVFHGFTVKPVLYGTLVCRLLKVPKIVNTITGLGFLFISQAWWVKIIRSFVGLFYKILFSNNNISIIFQNEDDQKYFISRKWVTKNQSVVIKGTGVDLQRFKVVPESDGTPVIVFPARLLLDKGIVELVEAADILEKKGLPFNLVLCGKEDPGNPSALSSEGVQALRNKGSNFKVLGHVEDMATAFQKSHIVCLPSYREGIPLALIEASASGRPIVTTDAPGCRSVVTDGIEGYLVPTKDSHHLALALEKLLTSKDLRKKMGENARSRAIKEFGKETIVIKNLNVYGPSPLASRAAS